VSQPVPTTIKAALVPNSSISVGIPYCPIYLFDIKLKFNFGEIFVNALKKAMITTVVKLVDNFNAQLYI
jgi:hypothetical protein